jgi:hypothetical protein
LQSLKYLSLLLLTAFFFVSCEKDDTSVIDPVPDIPNISNAYVTPNQFIDTSVISCIAVAIVSSTEALTVTARVTDPLNQEKQTIQLYDNGVLPDTFAGDGHYTGQINFTLLCRLIGTYNVNFLAQNTSGYNSNSYIATFGLSKTTSQPPFISDLIIPDSLQRPTSGFNIGFLQVKAIDPDGQCDIREVYFHSFRPDGTPTNNGNPFFMYDDGDIVNHCDTVANDTKYSLCISVPSTIKLFGYYKFVFNAKDRSDSVSNTLIDSIYIYQ